MEFTNYILESADVSDVDVMDIGVAQAMAEMAVLEAMMDCYEKQMVLLEYNYESAEEIFTEAETFVPPMGDDYGTYVNEYEMSVVTDYITEEFFDGEGTLQGWTFFNIKNDDGSMTWWAYNPKLRKYVGDYPNMDQVVQEIKGNHQHAKPLTSMPELEVDAIVSANPDYLPAPINNQPLAEIPRQQKLDIVQKVANKAAAKANNNPDQPIIVELKPSRKVFKIKNRRNKESKHLEKTSGQSVQQQQSDNSAANQGGANQGGANQAAQWDGSAAVSSASKSFKNSFKKFMSKAGSVIQRLVLGLIDSIFSVNFDKLADKLAEKGADFTMNDKQFQTINRIEELMETTQIYYANFDSMLLSRVNWTRAEVNKYKNALSKTTTALRRKYVDTGVFDSTTEQVNSPSKQTTPEDLIDICRALGKGEFKKLLRKCQKEAAAYNTDYNENANIPPEIGKEMRAFVNDLIKVYNKTAKDFKVMVNWSLEVGAVQENRNKNGGVDQSPIGFKKSPKAKELKQQRRAARKAQRNGAAAVEMYENLGGKEYANYDIGGEKTAAWAEEGWSMNLDDESYMYD